MSDLSRPAVALLAAASALLFASSAHAQRSDPPPDEANAAGEIVVQGAHAEFDEAETRKIVNSYIRELTVIDSQGPLALYEPGIYCPGVVGLSDTMVARIEQRMREVADAIGLEPAGPGCQTSALVLFVDDKDAFLKEFRRVHPVYFQDARKKIDTMPREDGPAVAWQLASLVDENGKPTGAGGTVSSYTGGSRIRSMTKQAIAMSVVVVERAALRGFDVRQTADYVLMRGLIGGALSQDGLENAATILTLLDTPMGEASYSSLTEWDFAYLKERYDGDPRAYADRRSGALRRAVRAASEDRPAQSQDRDED